MRMNVSGFALWRLGFRPFFLLGGLYAAVMGGIWAAVFAGFRIPLGAHFNPMVWHGHEMIYGFAAAIVVGFLLTASQNWSGRPGVSGVPLVSLVLLWVMGRVMPFFLDGPSWFYAVIDLAFLPVVTVLLIPYFWQGTSTRNRKITAILLLFASGNFLVHLEALGVISGWAQRGLFLGVDVLILLILLIGGRVLPFFTQKALGIQDPAPALPWAEKGSAALGVLFVISGLLSLTVLREGSALILGGLQFIRWIRWSPHRTLKIPILWILHSAYLWLILGLFFIAIERYWGGPGQLGLHVLTMGAIGVMILGMITRVSLGHTGRAIQAPAVIVLSYLLVNLSVLARVMGPLLSPDVYIIWIKISGVLWTLSFLIFALVFFPILVRPRVDGKPG